MGRKMIDNKKLIYEDLIEGFIRYQWRLDNPMPKPGESFEEMKFHFFSDPVFYAKVENLASSIMSILDKYMVDTETIVRNIWNHLADEYNQWESLGQDEIIELLKIAVESDTKKLNEYYYLYNICFIYWMLNTI